MKDQILTPGLSDHVVSRLPKRFQLMLELSRYLGLEMVIGLTLRRFNEIIWWSVYDGQAHLGVLTMREREDIAFVRIPDALVFAVGNYWHDAHRGFVFGIHGTPEEHDSEFILFFEKDGRPTTRLDIAMAIEVRSAEEYRS